MKRSIAIGMGLCLAASVASAGIDPEAEQALLERNHELVALSGEMDASIDQSRKWDKQKANDLVTAHQGFTASVEAFDDLVAAPEKDATALYEACLASRDAAGDGEDKLEIVNAMTNRAKAFVQGSDLPRYEQLLGQAQEKIDETCAVTARLEVEEAPAEEVAGAGTASDAASAEATPALPASRHLQVTKLEVLDDRQYKTDYRVAAKVRGIDAKHVRAALLRYERGSKEAEKVDTARETDRVRFDFTVDKRYDQRVSIVVKDHAAGDSAAQHELVIWRTGGS